MITPPKKDAQPVSLDTLLEKSAQLAYNVVQCISQGRHQQARSHLDELRFVRSLPRQSTSAPDAVAPSGTDLQRMRCALDSLPIALEVIQDWVSQRVGAVARGEVQDSIDIWQCLVDQALPMSWNFDTDLLVVFGAANPSMLAALEQRGQRRVLFVADMKVTDTSTHVTVEEPPLESTAARLGERLFARSENEIRSVVRQIPRPYPDRTSALNLTENAPDEAPMKNQVKAIHDAVLSLWMDANTLKYFGKTWIDQGIGNFPILARQRNLRELDGAFKGATAVLISPGPSLVKNIDQLKALKGKVLLIAPLQTLRRLYLAGVQPDFAVVIDAADQTVAPMDFLGGLPDDFLPPLVAGPTTHPNVLKRFREVLVYSTAGPLDHWFASAMGERLVPLCAPSVALVAFLLACHWQCQKIVLTGQDLALQNGQKYAAGSALQPGSKRRMFELPGWDGSLVQSPSDYYMFHSLFEGAARQLAEHRPHVQLFNCTEGGAYITGFEHLTLQSFVDQHLPATPDNALANTMAIMERDAALAGERIRRAVAYLEKNLLTIDATAKQVLVCRRVAAGNTAGKRFFKLLEAEEIKLRKLFQGVAGFSILYREQIDKALAAASAATTLQENLHASRALYTVVADGCEMVRPLVEKALQLCVDQVESVSDVPMAARPVQPLQATV